jgi:hypothetical protein
MEAKHFIIEQSWPETARAIEHYAPAFIHREFRKKITRVIAFVGRAG